MLLQGQHITIPGLIQEIAGMSYNFFISFICAFKNLMLVCSV